jgi:hypothetical protein
MSSYHNPMIGKKYLGAAVAMAGKIRGAVNACLDFFALLFGSRQKVEEENSKYGYQLTSK